MKGVILAGGKGSRLYPLTNVLNKQLLPIYNKPMIYYPIETLKKLGCTQLMIVIGENGHEIVNLIKNGTEFGLESVYYAYQEKAGGIADALKLAKNFINEDKFCMILGDNLILDDASKEWKEFEKQPSKSARVFIKKIENPREFGVAEISDNKIIEIIEKPENPKTDLAVVGLYFYDGHVFDIIDNIKPSKRGELEITTVNQTYIQEDNLYYSVLDMQWLDTGSFESLFKAQEIIRSNKI